MPTAKQYADALSATPRNSWKYLADAMQPVSEFADTFKVKQDVPLIGGMSAADFTGLKGAFGLADDASYGKYPIRGASLQTAKVDPRVIDAMGFAGALMPVAKNVGKAALGEVARQIHTGTGIGRAALNPRMNMAAEGIPKFPQPDGELRSAIAQRNAALPISEGGLGLPANNMPMDRAGAMGFDTPAYHGAFEDIHEFDNALLGKNTSANSAKQAHFFASSPETASSPTYATPTFEQANSSMMSSLGLKNSGDSTDFMKDYWGHSNKEGTREKESSAIFAELKNDVLKELNGRKLSDLEMHDETSSFLNNIVHRYDMPANYLKYNYDISNSQNLKDDGIEKIATKFRDLYKDIYKKDEIISNYMNSLDSSNKFDNIHYNEDYIKKYGDETAPSVYPVLLNTKNSSIHDFKGDGYREESYSDLISKARKEGFDSNIFKNTFDGGKKMTDVYAIFNPANIRSRFAAFDPFRRHEADILAGVGIGGMLDPEAVSEEFRKKERK